MAAELPVYPAALVLKGRPALVVGGGRVAARKVWGLVAAGALVTVVAPTVDQSLLAAAGGSDAPAGAGRDEVGRAKGAQPGLRVERRRYRQGEVARYRLAITATGDPQVDRLVFEDGELAGVFVNAADDPLGCSFLAPAVVRQGPVTVAISTGGASPALAAWLRARIEELLVPAYAEVAGVLACVRADVRARGLPTEGLDWPALIAPLLAVLEAGSAADLSRASGSGVGAVVADWLVASGAAGEDDQASHWRGILAS